MKRVEVQRKRRRRKIQFVLAWALLGLFEILIAAAPAAVVAAFTLTQVYNERGYYGVGGEWLLISLVFCVAYKVIHNWICNKIF